MDEQTNVGNDFVDVDFEELSAEAREQLLTWFGRMVRQLPKGAVIQSTVLLWDGIRVALPEAVIAEMNQAVAERPVATGRVKVNFAVDDLETYRGWLNRNLPGNGEDFEREQLARHEIAVDVPASAWWPGRKKIGESTYEHAAVLFNGEQHLLSFVCGYPKTVTAYAYGIEAIRELDQLLLETSASFPLARHGLTVALRDPAVAASLPETKAACTVWWPLWDRTATKKIFMDAEPRPIGKSPEGVA